MRLILRFELSFRELAEMPAEASGIADEEFLPHRPSPGTNIHPTVPLGPVGTAGPPDGQMKIAGINR
jgi:hypothetical protein